MTFISTEKCAVEFGLGTVEVLTGINDQMNNAPFILLKEWSEPQVVGLLNEETNVTGEATGKMIYLQFRSIESLNVLKEAIRITEEKLSETPAN